MSNKLMGDGWTRVRLPRNEIHFTHPDTPYPVKSIPFLGIYWDDQKFKSIPEAKAWALSEPIE